MSKTNGQSQEQAMDRQEFMALHQNNTTRAREGPSPSERASLIDNVVETELETGDKGLSNLGAKDFTLSNYDEEVDTVEFKWIQEIVNILSKSRHPHPGSGVTGLSRAWAAGDPTNRLEPLSPEELAQDEVYLLGTFSRAKRGEGMAQQETSGKMITESHAIQDSRDSRSSSGGGLLGRFGN